MQHVKDCYYFSHDSNARNDPKILEMRSVYGSEGYGWYWILIELLRDQKDYKLSLGGKYAYNAFAMQMQCDVNTAQKFIQDCINEFNLFVSDGECFWSNSLLNRMEGIKEKSEKARQSALSRWEKKDNANAMRAQCERNARKERKVNKSKVKETKLNKSIKDTLDIKKKEEKKEIDLFSGSSSLFLIFENEFGKKLTPIEAKQILNWQEKFGTDLIEEALRRSVLQGKLSLNYIGKILSSWESAGLRSIQDVLKNDPLRQAESATEATKVVQLQSRRREEKIKAACDYIALQLGPNPPREQAEEIARGYGEDTVAEILDKLYENGGRSP